MMHDAWRERDLIKLAEYMAYLFVAPENDKPQFVELKRKLIDQMTDDLCKRVLRVLQKDHVPVGSEREILKVLARVE